jgi:molecular chaperone GrpE
MTKPKGPKIDLPDELVAELEEDPSAGTDEKPAEAADKSPEEEIPDLKDRYLRLAADFENYKRRTLKERQDLYNYGNESLIKELLETVDNLERAQGHARESEEGIDAETLLEGVELTYRALIRTLEKNGVQAVQAEGEAFDPQVHEAIRQAETDEHPPGTVVEVYQKGYLLKDRLLRPALVVVATGRKEDAE